MIIFIPFLKEQNKTKKKTLNAIHRAYPVTAHLLFAAHLSRFAFTDIIDINKQGCDLRVYSLSEMAASVRSAKVHHLNGFSSQGSEINQITALMCYACIQ